MMKLTNKSHTTSLWGLLAVVGAVVHEMPYHWAYWAGKVMVVSGFFLVAYCARDAKKSSQDEQIRK